MRRVDQLLAHSAGWELEPELVPDTSEIDAVIAHTNMYWTWQRGAGRTASVVSTADVELA